MEAKKFEFVVTPDVTEALEKYKAASESTRGYGYDYRTKPFRDKRKAKEVVEYVVKTSATAQAIKYLADNGIVAQEHIINVYPGFNIDELAPTAYYHIDSSRYSGDLDLAKVSIEELKQKIQENNEEVVKKKTVEEERRQTARKMLGAVETDITYKDCSWSTGEEKVTALNWEGSELSARYEDPADHHWGRSAEIKSVVRKANEIECEFKVGVNFDSVEEAKAFWESAKEFVAKHGNKLTKEVK